MTKSSLVRCVVVASTLVTGAGALALQPERQQPAGQQPGQPGERGPGERRHGPGGPGGDALTVDQAMKSMNRPLRQLRMQVGDASKKEENLRLINDMQRGCVAAKGLPVPHEVTDLAPDEAAKTKMADEYRRDLVKVLGIMVEIEQNILDGNADAASAKIEELAAARDEAHKEMGLEDE